MRQPLLYDLYCKAGGATLGYKQVGFRVVGIDHEDQPRYIGDSFIKMDALEFLDRLRRGEFEHPSAIHASPPCQLFSRTRAMHKHYPYPDLLTPTRRALAQWSTPWVIENTPGAPGPWDLRLCGTMFGLRSHSPVHRHRLFQFNWRSDLPSFACSHTERAMNVYTSGAARNGTEREFCDAMGVTWCNVSEGLEAIPPAYTDFIGKQLMKLVVT